MFERVIEIIVYLISELRSKRNFADINVQHLKDLGYTTSEISTAFSWIADKFDFQEFNTRKTLFTSPNSFRILHPAEMDMFTKEAYGHMIQLHSLGIIENEHIEHIIDRAIVTGNILDIRTLKYFVASAIFDIDGALAANTARIILTGNESIN
ncbi:MAG: DUF494 domain-containing protein [Candidatus Kapabacteria bacterium]|nr:DUF494 domain-containing protein [Candidatus Kapabacteria bacterium]